MLAIMDETHKGIRNNILLLYEVVLVLDLMLRALILS